MTSSPWMDGDGSLSLVGQDFTPTALICLHLHKLSHRSTLAVVFHINFDSKVVNHNIPQRKNSFASILKFNKSFLKTPLL